MSTKWSKEDISKYIVCVQQYPCLYNVKSTEYLDRTLKAQAFNEILREMQECMPNISLEEIKTKLRNLRTQYLREKRIVDSSKKSGSGIADIYIPKVWWYDELDFLKNHVSMRPSEDNTEPSNAPSTSGGTRNTSIMFQDGVTATQSDFENTSSCFGADSSPFDEPQRKRPKKLAPVKAILSRIDNFQSQVLSQRNKVKEYEWLGMQVATQMENIDPEDRPDAAWKVQCVMRQYTDKAHKRKMSGSSIASTKDLLEQSMDRIFDESDFD